MQFWLHFVQNQLEIFNQIFNKWSTHVFQPLKLISNCNYWKQSLQIRKHDIYSYKSEGGTTQIKWWKHNWSTDLIVKFNDYTFGYHSLGGEFFDEAPFLIGYLYSGPEWN